jgi:isopentenyl phosphate kinase
LARELKIFTQRFPKIRIILLRGAGSFGHPLVFRHKLLLQPLTDQRLLGFVKTVCSTRHMANLLAKIFCDAKLPTLPLQTSAMAPSSFRHLKRILDAGFIPLLGGDMGLSPKNQSVVFSADKLAVLLAKMFRNSTIIFATNVNGVFDKFPAPENAKPLSVISRKKIKSMLKKMNEKKNRYDITGAMAGKLKTTLALKNKEVVIFNGLKPKNLTRAMVGEQIGTRLAL